MSRLLRFFMLLNITGFMVLGISGCSHTSQTTPYYTPASLSQGKQNFQAGNYKLAFSQLIPYAVKGNPDAEYCVGYMYYYGKGVDRNREIAESWIRRAAQQGHPLALKSLTVVNPKKRIVS